MSLTHYHSYRQKRLTNKKEIKRKKNIEDLFRKIMTRINKYHLKSFEIMKRNQRRNIDKIFFSSV
jgi:hypothetical protein